MKLYAIIDKRGAGSATASIIITRQAMSRVGTAVFNGGVG